MCISIVDNSLEYFHLQFESANILLSSLKNYKKYSLKKCNFNWNPHSPNSSCCWCFSLGQIKSTCHFQDHRKKANLIPSRHTWTSAALGWDASHASLYNSHHLYTFLLKTRSITHHRYQRVQMLISLTSVGVQDKSASLATHFDSLVLWCWTSCRLDSSRDSICSWHARKQSCKT